jgi:hydrogenase/urease accessory protein HupE
MKLMKVATILAGISLANIASAHPGHSPADVAAQVTQPFAGADHFVAFLALTCVLLVAFRVIAKSRAAKTEKARK